MSEQTIEMLTTQLRVLDRKLRRVCRQVVIFNNKIIDLLARYNQALKVDQRPFRHAIRLQLATIESLRNMCYEYACRSAVELEAIQDKLASV